MKILILGLNYAPERVGVGVYTAGMAEALAARGHQVSVICGQPYYPGWKRFGGFEQRYQRSIENNVALLRCPHYVPENPTGAKRVLHHLSFAISSFLPVVIAAFRERPDIVFTIAPSLIAASNASVAARVVGAKSWLHVQDFEVEAAFATELVSGEGRLARLARWFEGLVFRRFARVSSISPKMCERLVEKGVSSKKVLEFRNWGNVAEIHPLEHVSPYRSEWDIKTHHVALYSGNIANKQGTEIIVEAATHLRDRTDLTFVICGEGPTLPKLKEQAAGLPNIRFYPLQPRERLNDLLGLASVHLLPQIAGAADLVLPSKLINMLASGRPSVVATSEGTGLAIEAEGCGLMVKPGDGGEFARAIIKLLDDERLNAEMSATARLRAEQRWAEKKIVGQLEREFVALVNE